MAECVLTKAGGGTDLDAVTATAADIVAPNVIVGQDGEPITGTMVDRGNWNVSVGMNESITIPGGRHGGDGKVSGPNVTQRGAWTNRLGVNGKVIVPEGYHNGKGYVDQALTTMGAQTVTPGNSQKVVSCSGKYMTGNVTVPAVANLTAANIKKGVNVGGVVGTWEGYVANPTDLYYNGVNNAGLKSAWSEEANVFDSNQITRPANTSTSLSLYTTIAYNLTGYSRLVVEGYIAGNSLNANHEMYIRDTLTSDYQRLTYLSTTYDQSTITFSFNMQATKFIKIVISPKTGVSYIRRIRLS